MGRRCVATRPAPRTPSAHNIVLRVAKGPPRGLRRLHAAESPLPAILDIRGLGCVAAGLCLCRYAALLASSLSATHLANLRRLRTNDPVRNGTNAPCATRHMTRPPPPSGNNGAIPRWDPGFCPQGLSASRTPGKWLGTLWPPPTKSLRHPEPYEHPAVPPPSNGGCWSTTPTTEMRREGGQAACCATTRIARQSAEGLARLCGVGSCLLPCPPSRRPSAPSRAHLSAGFLPSDMSTPMMASKDAAADADTWVNGGRSVSRSVCVCVCVPPNSRLARCARAVATGGLRGSAAHLAMVRCVPAAASTHLGCPRGRSAAYPRLRAVFRRFPPVRNLYA